MKPMPSSSTEQSGQLRTTAFATLLTAFFYIGIAIPSAFAQSTPPPNEPKVRGQIVNKNDKPIPGATILVKNETTGTVSDINGFFELDLKLFSQKDLVLVIDFINYEKKGGRNSMGKAPKRLWTDQAVKTVTSQGKSE